MLGIRVFLALSLTLSVSSGLLAREPVRARHAMVGAQEPLAVDAGLRVLQAGGNAVDAAVAIGFALAVTHPSAGNLGGGGFLLVRLADGRTAFFDFREAAPKAATHDMYLDAAGNPTRDSIRGWRAPGIPGTVRGLELAHQKFGHLKWADLLKPAVTMASKGVVFSYAESHSICASKQVFSDSPEAQQIYLKKDGACYEMGDTLKQPDLARTLQRIAKKGASDFYEGETARRFADEMKKHGGIITLEDLKDYRVVEREPLKGKYKGLDIVTAPPPSSGGITLLQTLGMLEGTGYEKPGFGSAAVVHTLAEVMRRAYADRVQFLGDPGFVKVPVQGLLDPKYLAARRATIDPVRATPSDELGAGTPAKESTQTTHYNVIDAQGNVVAVTYTLNASYGNGIVVPGLGFLLNNEMDDFAAKPGTANMFGLVQTEVNAVAAGKRPVSSMTPTIVLKQNEPYLVLGAPGGSMIPNGVIQVFLNVVDFGMGIQDAEDAPRIHQQWKPDVLYLDPGYSPDTKALLAQRGYTLKPANGVARVESILKSDGWLQGGTDPRSGGKAAGY